MPAEKFFERALARVESASIRSWATNERNRPIWIQIAALYISLDAPETGLTADIVGTAIGLWGN